jgi:lysophospholipase L1-like esterase
MADVRADQLAAAVRRAPDLVLVAAGSNDVTHLRSSGTVRDDLVEVIDRLRAARCDVAIVVTGAADVGAAPRLAQPLRALAGLRTRQINAAVAEAARERDVVFAPIAERTGPLFRDDRSLFAPDDFHPSAAGYATWVPVLDEALGRALEQTRRASC